MSDNRLSPGALFLIAFAFALIAALAFVAAYATGWRP